MIDMIYVIYTSQTSLSDRNINKKLTKGKTTSLEASDSLITATTSTIMQLQTTSRGGP